MAMGLNSDVGLDFDLGETVDMLRGQVQAFAADEIAPRAADIDRDNAFPADLWRKMGELGVLGITVEEEYGGAGMGYLEHVVAMEEISRASASVGLSYGAHSNLCVNQIRRNGNDGAAAALSAAAGQRGACRRAGDERAGGGVGRRRHAHAGRAAGRPLRAERQQDVDHQRAGCGRAGGLCEDRSGGGGARDHGVPGREGVCRVFDGAEAGQAGHARVEHLRAGVPGLRGARGERARRGRSRRERADERAGLRARGAGGRAARHHAGLHGRGAAVCARTQAVRPADRRVPAHAGASSPTCTPR